MAKNTTKTRVRRTDEQLIQDLQAKIASLQRRAEEMKVRKDPARRHVTAALKAIDRAEKESEDDDLLQALARARACLLPCLSLGADAASDKTVLVPAGPRSSKGLEAETLLAHVRQNPGQRGEQIAAALGVGTKDLRPVMRKLIDGKQVKTKGQRRGQTYHPA